MYKRVALTAVAVAAVISTSCDSPIPTAPKQPGPPKGDIVQQLLTAYQQRNYDAFSALLSHEDGAEYRFFLDEPTDTGLTSWGFVEELRIRIHKRMFQPQSVPASDPPVLEERWLESITIRLTAQEDFTPSAPHIYRPPAGDNPDGLDAGRWKATEATYQTHVLFDTRSSDDFIVEGRANFIVIEDLAKPAGAQGKFLLYRWEDLGEGTAKAAGVEPKSWSTVKLMYK